MPIFINAAAVKELTNSAYASTGKGFACKTSGDMIDIFLSVGSGDVVISGRLTPSTRDFTYYPYATKSDLTPTTPQTIRSQCRYSKSGNVVVVSCQGLQTEIPANTWTTLFTMPVGYKPNFSIHSTAAFASDGSKPGLVRVDTDGVCSVYSKELTTVSWFTVLFLAGG